MNIIQKIILYPRYLKFLNASVKSIARLPHTKNLNPFFEKYEFNSENSKCLDIGCGTKPKNPFGANISYGIDIRENPDSNVKNADLSVEKIPYPDEHFEYVTAYDFIEHIPRIIYLPERRFPFVELMNEIHRVLKPNGIFFSYTPIYPFSSAFRDPTHVNIITEQTFPMYFDDQIRGAQMYGFKGGFKILDQILNRHHLASFLKKL